MGEREAGAKIGRAQPPTYSHQTWTKMKDVNVVSRGLLELKAVAGAMQALLWAVVGICRRATPGLVENVRGCVRRLQRARDAFGPIQRGD